MLILSGSHSCNYTEKNELSDCKLKNKQASIEIQGDDLSNPDMSPEKQNSHSTTEAYDLDITSSDKPGTKTRIRKSDSTAEKMRSTKKLDSDTSTKDGSTKSKKQLPLEKNEDLVLLLGNETEDQFLFFFLSCNYSCNTQKIMSLVMKRVQQKLKGMKMTLAISIQPVLKHLILLKNLLL